MRKITIYYFICLGEELLLELRQNPGKSGYRRRSKWFGNSATLFYIPLAIMGVDQKPPLGVHDTIIVIKCTGEDN